MSSSEESLLTSISFARLDDGGVELLISSLERGEMFRMRLAPADAMDMLRSFITVMTAPQ